MSELCGWRKREIEKIKEGLCRMYDEFSRDCLSSAALSGGGAPNIQIAQSADELVVRVACPALTSRELEVWVSPERLNIISTPEQADREHEGHEISVSLPVKVRPDACEANLSSGVLIVRMPKKRHPPARSIIIIEGRG